MKEYLNRIKERGLSGIALGIAVFLFPGGFSELFAIVMERFNLSYDGTRLAFYLSSGFFFLVYILLLVRKNKRDV
jgi:hypothetical protein